MIWDIRGMDFIYNFLGLLLFGFLFSVRKNYISSSFTFILWNFAGTFLHELSHFIVSLFLGGRPMVPYLFPHKKELYKDGLRYEYWVLGVVLSRSVNAFNAFYIGLAPVLLLVPVAFYVYMNWFSWFNEGSFRDYILFYLAEFILLYNALPSLQDIKVALSGWLGAIFFIVLLTLLFYLYDKGLLGNLLELMS